MKALVYEGVEKLAIRDMQRPVPDAGEHLIRVHAVGLCGSDMHAYLGHDERRPAPLILGHEAAGVIEAGPQEGRRVTINPLVTCRDCAYCRAGRENLCQSRQIISMPPREGAFAQFIAMPDSNLVTVPDNVPLATAALAEPLAVSWHAVRLGLEALHPAMERRALVIGGGAIGLAAALSLAAMGVDDVTLVEPNDSRRAYLTEVCGQTCVALAETTAPLVIDAVGYAATRATASQVADPGGVIVHVGLGDNADGLDIRRMTLQEITFIGTYTYSAQDFHDTAQAIFDGRLGALDWAETRALAAGAAAFADLQAGKVAAPKIILDPWA
ncbi:alcohol dehydrogenase catalytic domain-containing protein [Alisedimentitalea sp. MJ-SS2]|uniref:alcohol dehydrogenase catalytic domain-containing protein n=1 Tax=Aliisedimentitalea sp. MJ-SS2 TaxID=3049795 RepID=UPI0029112CAC|nr:alcohol dehydrogenase catalytic domain-containing protein [Alisedimentitalea sp. MJ-SS2]MDU8929219.1 alcohol dehydrogenase catalytic domain-containing protein [Alisedimentitalea sp. MJ-SS2]